MIHFPSSNGVSQGALRYLVNNSLTSSVSLTSSGFYSENYKPEQLLLFNSYYLSEITTSFGQWLQMEFIDYRIDLTHYSLYTPASEGQKMSWNFSISSDGSSWIDIHAKLGINILNGSIFESLSNNIRFFKWTCTGPSGPSGQWNYFLLRSIDVFGYLYPIDMEFASCSNNTNLFINICKYESFRYFFNIFSILIYSLSLISSPQI